MGELGIGASFWRQDALPHQPIWTREETLESGGSCISTSILPTSISRKHLLRPSCAKPSKIQEFRNHSFSETGAGTKGFINFVAPNKVEVKRTEG